MNKYLLLSLLMLSACSLAPDLDEKVDFANGHYKEQTPDTANAARLPVSDGAWQLAVPEACLDRQGWWKIFNDEVLSKLEAKAIRDNFNLKAAVERVKQARAIAGVADSALYPSIGIGADAAQIAPSNASYNIHTNNSPASFNIYRVHATVSYEGNLFGDVSDTANAAELDAAAQQARFYDVMLSLEADVAQNYFNLRELDKELKILDANIKLYAHASELAEKRFKTGYSDDLDLAQAQAQLALAEADSKGLEKRRAEYEHALATLMGEAPGNFTFVQDPLTYEPPAVPAGLPSELLERRPDIVAAENTMAAANKRIGVARAAFFPKLMVTALGGFESNNLNQLFNWSSRTWYLGPIAGTALTMPIFDGGQEFDNLDLAKAEFREAVDSYRQSVLTAFREVEDSLSDIRLTKEQSLALVRSSAASRRAAELAQKRYQDGDQDYFQTYVIEAQALQAERSLAQAQGQSFVATINLIRALGGGWTMKVIAKDDAAFKSE